MRSGMVKMTYSLGCDGACVAGGLQPLKNSGCIPDIGKAGDRCVTGMYEQDDMQ